MTWILGSLGLLCVIYYILIIIYSGLTTSMSFIWLFFAACLFLLSAGHEYYRRNPKKVPLWIPVSAYTVCTAGIVIFCIVEILVFFGAASADTPNLDYLIVLGARVRDDQVSSSLKSRLDKAIEYVEQYPDTVLVLSGGQDTGDTMIQAEVMYDYLEFNGVSPQQMILETFSTSTVENIAYSRVAIEKNQEKRKLEFAQSKSKIVPGPAVQVPDKPLRIGVLTSNYHVFRAKQIGKKWGIPDLQGIAASSDPFTFVHFSVRECIAILKDKLMGNM